MSTPPEALSEEDMSALRPSAAFTRALDQLIEGIRVEMREEVAAMKAQILAEMKTMLAEKVAAMLAEKKAEMETMSKDFDEVIDAVRTETHHMVYDAKHKTHELRLEMMKEVRAAREVARDNVFKLNEDTENEHAEVMDAIYEIQSKLNGRVDGRTAATSMGDHNDVAVDDDGEEEEEGES
jgi:phage-related minor tail protein